MPLLINLGISPGFGAAPDQPAPHKNAIVAPAPSPSPTTPNNTIEQSESSTEEMDDPDAWASLEGSPSAGLLDEFVDNLSLFGGLCGSKEPQDLGINANIGGRGAINGSIPVWERYGLGAQLGTAINYDQSAVAVLKTVDGTSQRTASFTTVGLFQRTDFGLRWGLGYDFLFEHYYQNIDLGQWRGQVGYGVGMDDEVGIWGTLADRGDNGSVAGIPFHLKAISQGNLYWRHTWNNEASTRFWVGMADEHGRFVLVLPDKPAIHHPFVFGADLFIPLGRSIALFGEANMITPNDSGTVTATLGMAFYPGGGAWQAGRNRFAPLLPVANNPSFAVDLER